MSFIVTIPPTYGVQSKWRTDIQSSDTIMADVEMTATEQLNTGTNLLSLPDEIIVMVLEYILPMKTYLDGSVPFHHVYPTYAARHQIPKPEPIPIEPILEDILDMKDLEKLHALHVKGHAKLVARWEAHRRSERYRRTFHPDILRVNRRL